jgi:hypothetical protein
VFLQSNPRRVLSAGRSVTFEDEDDDEDEDENEYEDEPPKPVLRTRT